MKQLIIIIILFLMMNRDASRRGRSPAGHPQGLPSFSPISNNDTIMNNDNDNDSDNNNDNDNDDHIMDDNNYL